MAYSLNLSIHMYNEPVFTKTIDKTEYLKPIQRIMQQKIDEIWKNETTNFTKEQLNKCKIEREKSTYDSVYIHLPNGIISLDIDLAI